MAHRSLSLAFVMDPLESIDIDKDTTFVLMLEAQRRGHRILYVDPADLGVAEGEAVAVARPLEVRRQRQRPFEPGPPETLVLDEGADVVLQRKDPPVDAHYVTATQILTLCRRALVVNRPQSILSSNEKLYALHFPDLMPTTIVTSSIPKLTEFMEKMGGEMVVKPLDGKGGEGVFYASREDRNLSSILEQITAFESRPIVAQRYVPEIRRGDKRILLVEGEPIGALMRVPGEREFRANLHVGGRAERTRLDADDRRIVERIAPRLREEGLFFVGIDVIGGLLTEVNVTSPTGIQEANALENDTLETRVIERLEALVAR